MTVKRPKQLIPVLCTLMALSMMGCKQHMPHSFTWPVTGDQIPTHPKPPEGGYYTNWDPFAVELTVEPLSDVNPVRSQHVLIATIRDEDGNPLSNRRVEWMIPDGSVGAIVEVDESGWRASRGYKVSNKFAVSHTNNYSHVLTRGNDDPSDDIHLEPGQTWCVITSAVEGETHVIAYAPGIYNWEKHKVFVVKHWYDVAWEFPPEAVNPVGTQHEFTTRVMKHSDGTPLAGYVVNYQIVDGPSAMLQPGGGQSASVETDENGMATVTIVQSQPAEGTNTLQVDIIRPEDVQCCKPAAQIASGMTRKTWIGPKIAIEKTCTPQAVAGEAFSYNIVVTNPSDVDADNVSVTDALPQGISYVSSAPPAQVSGQVLSWNLGTVPARGSRQLTVQVQGTQTGRYENCADVQAAYGLSGRDCCTTVIAAPSLVIEKRCPAEVTTCDTIEYTIVVRNTGDGPATNVNLTDNLPSGLTTSDGRTSMSSSIGTLAPGEAKQATITVRADRTGEYTNVVSASADGGLTAEASCTTIVRQPVLEVTKTGPELRYIGRGVDYQLTVRNTGDAPARQTVLVDNLPNGTQFVAASDGGRFANGQVTWDLGTLAPGASKTVSLEVKALTVGTARNTATVTAVCAQDDAMVETALKGIPAILLEVIDIEDPVEVGTNTTYVITVTNQGSADDNNIRVECEIPPEMEFVSASGATSGVLTGNEVRFDPLPLLAPKAKATFQVVVKGVRSADVRFKVVMNSDNITREVQETEATNVYE